MKWWQHRVVLPCLALALARAAYRRCWRPPSPLLLHVNIRTAANNVRIEGAPGGSDGETSYGSSDDGVLLAARPVSLQQQDWSLSPVRSVGVCASPRSHGSGGSGLGNASRNSSWSMLDDDSFGDGSSAAAAVVDEESDDMCM